MEVKMDMQPVDMLNMHNTFWRDDQVSILFLSNVPIFNEAGKLNKTDLGRVINGQAETVSHFLQQQVSESPVGDPIQVQLHFLNDDSHAGSPPMVSMYRPDATTNAEDDSEIPPGVYPFEVTLPPTTIPIPIGAENVKASFASFFKIEDLSQPGGAAPADSSLMLRAVKKINTYLEVLNQQEAGDIVAAVAAPVWLTGGTGITPVGQGCPLTPPIPVLVNDSCSNWHYKLPNLSSEVQLMTGDGITVFVLDSFPERGVIARAARDAGDNNRLLRKVDRTVSFDYGILSGVQEIQDMRDTQNAFVGKDVYGRHYAILMPDHGLFIAGIIRDLAPKARIECIRVLNDLCVGDAQLITNALSNIYQRKIGAVSDALDGKPVVINMSLVIPTDDELQSKGVDLHGGAFNDIRAALFFHIKALTDLGVVIAASAGNEGDLREVPGSSRPDSLYPAKFCYEPYNDDGIIPVGAVNSTGNAATYSCYPGLRGVATYGGEVPAVLPEDPPSANPSVDTSDMPRGIYSSVEYPPRSADPPEQYYAAPDDHAWAYWVGTSFATPIVSALAARILQQQPSLTGGGVHDAVLNEAAGAVQWINLAGGAQQQGKMLLAVQECVHRDHDEGDEDG
jgi:subtilisin family serine protease